MEYDYWFARQMTLVVTYYKLMLIILPVEAAAEEEVEVTKRAFTTSEGSSPIS